MHSRLSRHFPPRHPFSQPALVRLSHDDARRPDPNQEAQAATPPSPPSQENAPARASDRVSQQPHYELTFTCVPCGERSRHKVSKQGYHQGSVLITCPECRNRHVISDHLGIFGGERGITVEDLLRDKGQLVKRGTLGEDGDVEFWEDGSVTERERGGAETQAKEQPEDEENPYVPGSSFKSVRGSS